MLNVMATRILVTGADGFLGRHIVQELGAVPDSVISTPGLPDTNLLRQEDCERVVKDQDIVIHAAGKVGGIGANRAQPGRFFYENALMGMQLLEATRQAGVRKFVQVGTVCSYPKEARELPYREEDLWLGYPEETNGPYGLAKKMLLVQGQAYRQQYNVNVIHLLLVNLYGPHDHFGSADPHVIPALIHRFWQAKQDNEPEVICWGTGTPTREFLYVADAARGIVLAMQHYDGAEPINLGSGQEISIKDLAETIAELIGYQGRIAWDTSKPDGQPRRLFDVSKAEQEFGFRAATSFEAGLRQTVEWYRENVTVQEKAYDQARS